MKNLMRPGTTMVSGRSRLTFEQRKKSLQSSSLPCGMRNKMFCVLCIVILVIIIIFCVIYFDVASHTDLSNESQTIGDVIIEPNTINTQQANGDIIIQEKDDILIEKDDNNNNNNIEYSDVEITSRTAYMSTLEFDNPHFLNLLHHRSLGFDISTYNEMQNIISEYGKYANEIISFDISSGSLNGEYIIITPAAQMCNRMRTFMGSMLLGILTKRIVFIDIGAEGYAARFNNIFLSPSYQWELKSLPSKLKNMLLSTRNKQKWTFPYESLKKNRGPNGIILNQICSDQWINNDKTVFHIDSHAAFLPVMARNQQLYNKIINKYNENNNNNKYKFDYDFANYFMSKISENGQEYIEPLEVLLGRFLFQLDNKLQLAVDNIIKQTYEKAFEYYKSSGINMDETGFNMINNPPPIIGIHIRSEYVLLMNPKDCPGKNIAKCIQPYNWFEQCGYSVLISNKYFQQLLGDIKPYIFIAADTKEAQIAANKIFGEERVFYRPFDKTGGSFEGIQEAIIDLISVSSFDIFVGTPHSSYSEMASILSQPRRIYNGNKNKFEFKWNYNEIIQKHMVPINRMIIPMMSTIDWEIDKLNLYTMGRTIDINIDENNQILIPETNQNRPDYKINRICKQTVTAGMGWMGLFDTLKNVQCYDTKWHHPSTKWFPIANK